MELLALLRTQARANRLANHRLHTAMAPLSRDDFHAPRTSYFPSLAATLNHILAVDVYYLAALAGQADMVGQYEALVPCDTLQTLAAAQAASDARFIGLMDALAAEYGIDPNEAEGVWSHPAWKARLKAANDAAICAGVFGAPTFVIDNEPFWGNDRRPQIERWLEKGPF